MAVKIQKWGNSLGVRIPKAVALATKLGENSEVEVSHQDGAIIILPVSQEYRLGDLVAGISKENVHHEILDEPVGREVW